MLGTIYRRLYGLTDHPTVRRVTARLVPHRLKIILATHAALFSLSYAYAMILLNYGVLLPSSMHLLARTLIPLVVIRMAVYWYHGLHQGMWRYVSFEDLLNIIRATIISTLIFYALGLIWKPMAVEEEIYLLDTIFCIVLVGGVRLLVRNLRENVLPMRSYDKLNKVLVVGPVKKVHPLIKEIISNPDASYNPVAIIDPTKKDMSLVARVSDIPVYSFGQLKWRSKPFRNLGAVVVCWPEATRRQLEKLVEELKHFQVPFKTLPQVEDILSGNVSVSDIREVELEDLLERPPVHIEMERIADYVHDKTVLVTGGGGSIGSELCRQVAGFKPRKLVVVERSEANLYDLQLELKRRFPDLPLYGSISSINDGEGMNALLRKTAVDVVFHAAAYKHVPLMENVPIESAYNNILGTYNIARAAKENGVKRFVMISTDKAVNPTNVMGVTKRIAEMIVQAFSDAESTRFMIVRFGNVLGSAGSVIPIFKRQLAAGQPITVTDPGVERFFMTTPEAVQLVLQAGCMGSGGEVFVLDMGRPVKVLDLAEKLITLSGKRPYVDVDIVYSGLRPGEKMYEELFNTDEKRIETDHPRVFVARANGIDKQDLERQVAQIRQLVAERDEAGMRRKFQELVPGYVLGREYDMASKMNVTEGNG